MKQRDYKLVEELLSSSTSDPDGRSKYGWCPLHIAVVNDDRKMVQILLDHGADVHIEDLTNPYLGPLRGELFSDRIHLNAPTQVLYSLYVFCRNDDMSCHDAT